MHDIFSNPKLKAIMTVYVMMMGFDLFGRIMLPTEVAGTSAQTTSDQQTTGNTGNFANQTQITPEDDKIPVDRTGFESSRLSSNLATKFGTAHVHVSYCVGCQMNGAFKQLEDLLRQNQIEDITAEDYPIPAPQKLLGNLVSYAHWGILILLMAGEKIFASLGITPHPLYYKAREKQWVVIIASYFITSQLSGYLLNSGAFEVFLNEELIFSKLNSKKMPDPTYLASLIYNKLK